MPQSLNSSFKRIENLPPYFNRFLLLFIIYYHISENSTYILSFHFFSSYLSSNNSLLVLILNKIWSATGSQLPEAISCRPPLWRVMCLASHLVAWIIIIYNLFKRQSPKPWVNAQCDISHTIRDLVALAYYQIWGTCTKLKPNARFFRHQSLNSLSLDSRF